MAINQILGIPDWQKLSTYTSSIPAPGFSQIYPGPDRFWYVQNESGVVKRLGYAVQFGNGLQNTISPTESFVDFRVDVRVGSGLSHSYQGAGSEIYVYGLTTGNLSIIGSFTQGYVLSAATSGDFKWIAAGSASVQGTSGSIAKFTSDSSVGDSIMREVSNSVLIGATPVSVISNTRFGVSGSVYVSDNIYIGDNPNRYIGLANVSDTEISTTGDFNVTSYPFSPVNSSKSQLINANTDFSTYSTLGHDRNIDLLSGLVSVNQRPGYPALFVNATPAGLTGVSPSNMVRTPVVVFTSSNAFLGTITGTFGVALGLSGGGIQIQDGTEGQYRVLVSSTTQGHGMWATMVGIQNTEVIYGTESALRIPIYQKPGSFELADRYTGPTDSSTDGVSLFIRSYTYSMSIAKQFFSQTRYWDGTRIQGGHDVVFQIPNTSATFSNFIMSRSQQIRYGSLFLYDENEVFGLRDSNSGLFVKDLSNTVLGPGSNGNYAFKPGNRHNAVYYLLNSDKSRSQGLVKTGWNFPEYNFLAPASYSLASTQETLGSLFWPRSIYNEDLTWFTPTDFLSGGTISATQGQPDRFSTLNSISTNLPKKRGGLLDIQVVRRKGNYLYNQPSRDKFVNILYNYELQRMISTYSLTQSINLDTITSHYFKIESGEFTGSITQSTVLFVNPQFGSFTFSGIQMMNVNRQVGIHVSQEVGVGPTGLGQPIPVPLGTVKEAYDFISARISNGHTESNIQSHIGFFAQSKYVGTQWNPIGRRFYKTLSNPSTGVITGANDWPTYSLYNTNKPWGFYAEKDKSNFGGGVLIDIGATFGTTLNAYLEIQGVTGIFNNSPSTNNLFDLDGSIISVGPTSFGPLLPQILLRPGLTPSSQPDGSIFYTPGFLAFVDNGITYNLIGMSGSSIINSGGGVTGIGTNNYVPVWTGPSTLKATSSIYISDAGDGNVGINLKYYPDYSLQVATTSLSPNIALGISGSILYQDGSSGTTGSVMMTDSTGKTNLYPLVLPGPGLTSSYARDYSTVSSGYIPLFVGRGNSTGPSGSSEYQLGPIMTDRFGSQISLLISKQTQIASSNGTSTRKPNITFTVPSLVNTVPNTGLTVSVDFLMDYGDQTVYGQKTFHKSVFIGPTSGSNNGIFLYGDDTANYSGFVGPTGLSNNLIYRLPPTSLADRYLKVESINGNTYNLIWATVSASSGSGNQGPTGPTGTDGTNGTNGAPGGPGADGSQGPTGFQGPTGPRGATGATGVVSIGVFTQTNFYPYGATLSSTGVLTLGAAGPSGPGLVHTGSQTFSGDKYFQGDVFIGPTNTNGIFLFDSKGLTYSGFVGPTGLPSNLIYRLPSTASTDRYLKTCTNDGVNWNLVWATASAPASGLVIPSNEIVFGNGSGVTSDSEFTFNPTTCDFIASSSPTNTPSGVSINSIIGGNNHTMISAAKSSIIGGDTNTISDADCSLITTSRASSICPGLSTGATIKSGIIIGGDNNQIIGSGSNFASIINGNNQSILGTNSFNSTIMGGISNKIEKFSETSTIIGGDCNVIFHGKCSAIISSKCSSICLNANATSADTLQSSIIIGGLTNVIFGTSSTFTTILNGNNQCICGCGSNNSAIIAGDSHLIGTSSNNSVLIGGTGHKICTSANSLILGGSGLTLSNTPNTVYVPQLMINSVTPDPGNQTLILMWNNTDKKLYAKNISSLPGGGGGATLSLVGFDIGTFSTSEIQGGGNRLGATTSVSGGYVNMTFSAASSQNPGMVSTTTQSFIGQKQFLDNVFIGSSTGTQSTGLFIYDNSTYSRYTGFSSPATVSNNFVYQLPGVTGSLNQFLTIASVSSSGVFTTYSTSWSYPQAGVGLTVSNTGVINLINITPNTIIIYPGTFSGTYFTVSTADNGKLLDINTGGQVIYIDAPSVTQSFWDNNIGDRGFEFRVRKVDTSQGIVTVNIPEIGGTANSPTGFPFVHITRQNQIYEFKYNYAYASWASYQVDMGYISPNTFVGNLTGVTGYGEEYEFIDYNDPVQKTLNYTEGGFNNDWLSGVIYSSIDPLVVKTPTSGALTYYGLLTTTKNGSAGVGHLTTNTYIGTNSIPSYALTRGKSLRLKMSGTYSNSSTSANFSDFYFTLGGVTVSQFTYLIFPSTASFDLEYDLKVRYGGQSGSVYGSGKIIFDEKGSPGTAVYAIHSYDRGFVDVNLATNSNLEVFFTSNPFTTSTSITVNNAIIERLA